VMSKRGRSRSRAPPSATPPMRLPSQSAQLAALERAAASEAAEAAKAGAAAASPPPLQQYVPAEEDDDDDGQNSSESSDSSSSSSSIPSSADAAFEAGHDLRDPAVGDAIDAHEAEVDARAPKEPRKRKKHNKRKTSVVWTMYKRDPSRPDTFECLLHEHCEDETHARYVGQAGNATTNLLNHARRYHQLVVDALAKAHNDRRDVKAEFDALVRAMKQPSRGTGGLLNFGFSRLAKGGATAAGHIKDIALLVCFIANNIPFNVMDSAHFSTWMTSLGTKYQSKATVLKLLGPLYAIVLQRREDVVRACGSFSTTFDLWTSLAGGHYCVVTYHALDAHFTMISATLDLIPMACSAYGEFIYMSVNARIRSHGFGDMLHAASFSDSGSNVAAAKALLTPGDDEPCFNHNLKHVIDDVLGGSPGQQLTHLAGASDFAALAMLVAHVRGSPLLRAAS
jgi:hypothetical protein